mgnify:FL=1
MTQHGFKETGVVNIAEPVMFELAGQEETKDQQSTKGVGNLLNMDTFSALRQLRNKVTSGDITEEEYQAERFKLLGKAAPEGGPGSFPCCVRGATACGSPSIRNSSRTFGQCRTPWSNSWSRPELPASLSGWSACTAARQYSDC